MPDRNQLQTLLQSNTTQLLNLIADIPETKWNQRPEEGKWSPGEITDHILLTDSAIHDLFNGPTVVATDRIPLSKEKLIKDVFLDHAKKLKAFGPMIPVEEKKDKKVLMQEIKKVRNALSVFLDKSTTSELCMGFSHGKFGLLTKLEWIYFIIYHTQRHLSQIDRALTSFTR